MDPEYDAILLNIDSPGGGVTASDEIYRALMGFRESHPDRKIVVHIQDMAASGGYYAALAADQIVAQPTSIVGSIGVLISAVNFHKLGEKLGVEDVTLASSDNKALLNALDPVDPEHTAILQQVVDDMYSRFRSLVLQHRPITEEFAEQHQLLDGRIFTLPDALDFGLVDRVGYGEVSRQAVLDLLNVGSAAFYEVSYASPSFSLFSAKGPELKLPALPRSRFMYLWTP
jgi:protease-4